MMIPVRSSYEKFANMKSSSTQTRSFGDNFYTQMRSMSSGGKALPELHEMYSPPPSMIESDVFLPQDEAGTAEAIKNVDLSKMVKI